MYSIVQKTDRWRQSAGSANILLARRCRGCSCIPAPGLRPCWSQFFPHLVHAHFHCVARRDPACPERGASVGSMKLYLMVTVPNFGKVHHLRNEEDYFGKEW